MGVRIFDAGDNSMRFLNKDQSATHRVSGQDSINVLDFGNLGEMGQKIGAAFCQTRCFRAVRE
jgi:hypothetical protein